MTDAAPRAGDGIRLATWNVHGCVGRDGRFSPQRSLAVIARLDADILGLQEVDARAGPARDGYTALRDGTGLYAVEGPLLATEGGGYGNLLLSRWPARTVRRVDLSVPGREPRGALDVVIDTPLGPLRLLVTHLGLRVAERRTQIATLRAQLRRDCVPVTVVMGDLNVARWQGPDLFGRRVPRAGPAPRTFPAQLPVLALDRMQASPGVLLRDVRAHRCDLSRHASDHLPLVGVLDASSWQADGGTG